MGRRARSLNEPLVQCGNGRKHEIVMAPRKAAKLGLTTAGDRDASGPRMTPRNLNEVAYTEIKDDIISCALRPGQEISEGMLVALYDFGKAPIRSALIRLRQEGLVISRGRMSTIVSPVSIRDVREVFQLRLVLEVAATRFAAGNVDPDRIRALNDAVHSGYTPGDSKSEQTFVRANRELHRYVAQASGNQRLATMVADLLEQHERIVHLGLALQNREQEFIHHHDDLVAALIEGDGDRAAELAERSVRNSQKRVLEALMSSASDLSMEVVPPGS